MKRKYLEVQKLIYKTIKSFPGITMSELERKIGTNPSSLKEHCEHLAHFGLIKVERSKNTTKLFVIKNNI